MNAAHPLDGLLDDMVWPAARLVGAVRARDPREVAAVLDPLDRTGLSALLIAVAAMVPDDQTVGQLTLWTHGPVVDQETYDQIAVFDVEPGMKRCHSCGEVWRLEEFNRDKTKADDRKPDCRQCMSKQRKERKNRAGRDTDRSPTARCEPQRERAA